MKNRFKDFWIDPTPLENTTHNTGHTQRECQPVQVLRGDHDVGGGVHPQFVPKVELESVSEVVEKVSGGLIGNSDPQDLSRRYNVTLCEW